MQACGTITVKGAKVLDRPDRIKLTPSRILVPALVLVFAIPLFFYINHLIYSNLENERIITTSKDLATVQAKLSSELQTSLHLLHGLTALIQAKPDLSYEEFNTYAAALRPKGKGIISIAVAPDYVIKYLYPLKGNESALGLDYRVTPTQWIAVKECVRRRDIVVAGPLTLIQGHNAVIGRSPVFLAGEEKLWGIVSMPMDFDTLIKNSNLPALERRYEIAIRGRDSRGAEGEVFYGNEDVFSRDPVIVNITLPTGYWQLAAIAHPLADSEKGLIYTFYFISFFAILLMVSVSFLIHRNMLLTKISQESIKKANDTIEKRYEEISILNKDLQAFNYSISNTLKVPLRHIAGYSKILAEEYSGVIDDDGKTILSKITSSAGELDKLLKSLHRLSRAASQGLESSSFCLKTMAFSALKKAKENYKIDKVNLVATGDFNIVGDIQLIRLAVDILIDNAVKFTRNTPEPEINITSESKDNFRIITITDNGKGFDNKAAEDIFIPYHSYHTHGDFSGIGLGLATAKRIIQRHGGDITATGERNKWATFIITLPEQAAPPERSS